MIETKDRASFTRQANERRRGGPRVLSNAELVKLARNPVTLPSCGDDLQHHDDSQRRYTLRPIILLTTAFWAGVAFLIFV